MRALAATSGVIVLLALVAAAARGAQTPAAENGVTPAPAPHALDAEKKTRAIARMLVQTEGKHRTQVAELEHLIRTFEKSRGDAELRLAIEARHMERDAYVARMREFERDLGPELYARFRKAMDVGAGTEPPLRAIPPEPPPPPEPLPHEIEAQDAEKRRSEEGREDG